MENKSLKILIVVLIILLLGSIAYIIYGKMENKENISNKEENNTEDSIKITSQLLYDSANDENKEFTYKYDDNSYNFNITQEGVLYSNDKLIYDAGITGINKVYSIGDLLAINTKSTDVRGIKLIFVDLNGNIIKEIGDIQLENCIMNISYLEDSIKFNDDTITIKTTSYSHGPSIVLVDNVYLPLLDRDYTDEDYNKKAKYNITDDTITASTYQFKYLGNNKFSDMEIIESETLKQAKSKYE